MNISNLHIPSKGNSVRNKLYSNPLKFQVLSWPEAGDTCWCALLGRRSEMEDPSQLPFSEGFNVRVKNKCHDDCQELSRD